jgi:hypothetical protein
MDFRNGLMRIPKIIAATALSFTVASLCACTGVVGLAHGDPGRAPQNEPESPVPAAVPDTAAAPMTAPDAAVAPTSTVTTPSPPSTTSPGTTPPVAALPNAVAVRPAAVGAITAVTVTFNDHAQQLAAADPRLTAGAIAAAVETELQAHQLYAPAAGVHRTLTITVEDLTTTMAANATVMGYTFRNVMLSGGVQVQGESTAERSPFEVRALARMADRGTAAGGGSLSRLYTRFAVLTVADLRGVAPPSLLIPR